MWNRPQKGWRGQSQLYRDRKENRISWGHAGVGVGAKSTQGGRMGGRNSKCGKQSVSRYLLLSVQLPSVNVTAGDHCKMWRFSLFLPLRPQKAEVSSRRPWLCRSCTGAATVHPAAHIDTLKHVTVYFNNREENAIQSYTEDMMYMDMWMGTKAKEIVSNNLRKKMKWSLAES